jgi:hypothetical protein
MFIDAALDDTVAAKWRRQLVDASSVERGHWLTKVAYYQAVIGLIERSPGRVLTWRDVVAAVKPRGSRTTFYDVTGSHATHPLIRDYQSAGTVDTGQIAWRFRRTHAVEQLIDEAKVWAYWPYRDRWRARCRRENRVDEPFVVESLLAAVMEWARARPALAAALGQSPPLSAVEDLTLVRAGRLAPTRAFTVLENTIGTALANPAEPVPGQIRFTGVPVNRQPSTSDSLSLAAGL